MVWDKIKKKSSIVEIREFYRTISRLKIRVLKKDYYVVANLIGNS